MLSEVVVDVDDELVVSVLVPSLPEPLPLPPVGCCSVEVDELEESVELVDEVVELLVVASLLELESVALLEELL